MVEDSLLGYPLPIVLQAFVDLWQIIYKRRSKKRYM